MSKLIVSEEFLQQVETLQTVLRNNVAGMFGGNRKSKTYGSSCVFPRLTGMPMPVSISCIKSCIWTNGRCIPGSISTPAVP